MNTQFPPKMVRDGEGECFALGGETRHQLLDDRDTGTLALARSQFLCGAGAPPHLHTQQDQWLCVQNGQFHFQFGKQTQTLTAGDCLFCPRGVPLGYTCHSQNGELIIGGVGTGYEGFLRELAAQNLESASLTTATTRDLAATHGVFFDGFDSLEFKIESDLLTAPHLEPKIVRAGQSQCLEAFGDRAQILVSSSDSGGAFCLALSQTPSFCGPPPHLHQREDEVFLIREGRYEFLIGDARVQAQPGDVVFAPRGVPHTFRVVSDEPGHFLLFTTPGGFDLFFAACAQLFQEGGATPQLIGQIAAAHQLTFLTPEI